MGLSKDLSNCDMQGGIQELWFLSLKKCLPHLILIWNFTWRFSIKININKNSGKKTEFYCFQCCVQTQKYDVGQISSTTPLPW